MRRFHPPWETLKILLNPQAFRLDGSEGELNSNTPKPEKFDKANSASFYFWSSIVIHLMPISMVCFTGGMSIAFFSILAANYLLMSYFVGASALGYTPEEVCDQSPEEKAFDTRMLLLYSIMFMLTGAWPLIYFKLAAPAGIIGMIILPIYLLLGLSTILHYFYQAPSPDQAGNCTMLQHVYGFIAERILPKSLSLHHMVKSRIDNAVLELKKSDNPNSTEDFTRELPVATEVVSPGTNELLRTNPDYR